MTESSLSGRRYVDSYPPSTSRRYDPTPISRDTPAVSSSAASRNESRTLPEDDYRPRPQQSPNSSMRMTTTREVRYSPPTQEARRAAGDEQRPLEPPTNKSTSDATTPRIGASSSSVRTMDGDSTPYNRPTASYSASTARPFNYRPSTRPVMHTEPTASSRSTALSETTPKVNTESAKEDFAKKWLSAADGALGQGASTQERLAKLYDSTTKTNGKPLRTADVEMTARPITRASEVETLIPRPPPTKSKSFVEEEEKPKHSVFSEDSEEDDAAQTFAQKKAERFMTKASTVLSEDKIITEDPRVLSLVPVCRVVLRSFRGTYLKRSSESTRAETGGSPFDVERCEFTVEKVSTAPSKVLLFGDKIYIRHSASGYFLSGSDFTKDSRSTWTVRKFVDRNADFSMRKGDHKRSYVCSSDAIVLDYDANKRVLGVPAAPHDAEGTSYASLEVTPLEDSQKWFIVRAMGHSTLFLPPDANDSSISAIAKEEDDEERDDQVKRPIPATRYVLDVCLGLYPFSTRLENQIRTSEDILLIDRLRPIATSLHFLRQYASTRSQAEYGKINHALCFHLQESVLDSFDDFAASFTGKESLTLIFSAIQPRARIILDWTRVLTPCVFLKGGALLNALHAARIGSFENKLVCEEAIVKSVQPYLGMLYTWMSSGKVDDPFHEFCIVENEMLERDELIRSFNSRFWTNKFTLREEKSIPWFVQPYVDIVLKTGRNCYAYGVDSVDSSSEYQPDVPAVRHQLVASTKYQVSTNGSVPGQRAITIQPTTKSEMMKADTLQRMYSLSCHRLLQERLKGEFLLMDRFVFLKRYFMLDHMDFFLHFMDVAGEDLTSQVKKGTEARLKVHLQVAMRDYDTSLFVDELTCTLLPFAIDSHVERIHHEVEPVVTTDDQEFVSSQLRGVDGFALEMTPSWPLAVVFPKRVMTKYQLLFRHLFRCKHAERRIESSWMEAVRGSRRWMGADVVAQSAIMRMTHFLQSLQYHMNFEVIEPRWKLFWAKAQTIQDVDELLACHEDMIDSCLRECLLTNPTLIRQMSRLLRLCLSLGDLLLDDDVTKQCDPIRVSEFDQELVSFLTSLRTEANKGQIRTEYLYNLATRLDFSDFYDVFMAQPPPPMTTMRRVLRRDDDVDDVL